MVGYALITARRATQQLLKRFGGGCAAAAVALMPHLAVAQDADIGSDWAEINETAGAILAIARALGVDSVSQATVLEATRTGLPEAADYAAGMLMQPSDVPIAADGLAFQDALCSVLAGFASASGPDEQACQAAFAQSTDVVADLNLFTERLQQTSKVLATAYDRAVQSLVLDMARSSDLVEGEAEDWWAETGEPAVIALDRLGREYLKLARREGTELEANARDFLVSRLKELLRRDDVSTVALILARGEPSFFGALDQIETSPDAALAAAGAVSQWVQDEVGCVLGAVITQAISGTYAGCGVLGEALFERVQPLVTDLAPFAVSLEPLLDEEQRLIISDLHAALESQRQALERVLQFAEGLPAPGADATCGLPTPLANRVDALGPTSGAAEGAERAKLDPERIEQAGARLKAFLASCAAEGEAVLSNLTQALEAATPETGGPITRLQAICTAVDKVRPTSRALITGALSALGDVTEEITAEGSALCKMVTELPTDVARFDAWVEMAGDEIDPEVVGQVKTAVAALSREASAALLSRFERRVRDMLVVDALGSLEQLASFGAPEGIAYEGCGDPRDVNRIGIDFALTAPRLEQQGEDLFLVANATARLCRRTEIPPAEGTERAASNDAKVHTILKTFDLSPARTDLRVNLSAIADAAGKDLTFSNLMQKDAADRLAAALTTAVARELEKGLSFEPPEFNPDRLRDLIRFVSGALGEEALAYVTAVTRIIENYEVPEEIELGADSIKVILGGSKTEGLCFEIAYKSGGGTDEDCLPVLGTPEEIQSFLATRLLDIALPRMHAYAEALLKTYGLDDASLEAELTRLQASAKERGVAVDIKADGLHLEVDVKTFLQQVAQLDEIGVLRPSDLTGQVRVVVPWDDDFTLIDRSTISINVAQIAQREFAPLLDSGFVLLSSIIGVDHCMRVEFTDASPIVGKLGQLCWTLDDGIDFTPEAAPLVLAIPALGVEGAVELDEGRGLNSLELDVALGGTRPRDGLIGEALDGVQGLGFKIDFAEKFVIMSDRMADNDLLFRNIERRIALELPGSLRLKELRVSERSVNLVTEPSLEGFVLNSLTDPDLLAGLRAKLGNLGAEGCDLVRLGTAALMVNELSLTTELKIAFQASGCATGRFRRDLGVDGRAMFSLPDVGDARGADLMSLRCGVETTPDFDADVDHDLTQCTVTFIALPGPCEDLSVVHTKAEGYEPKDWDQCLSYLMEPVIPADMLDTMADELNDAGVTVGLACGALDANGLPENPLDCAVTLGTALPMDPVYEGLEIGFDDCEIGSPGAVPLQIAVGFDGEITIDDASLDGVRDSVEDLLRAQAICAATPVFETLAELLADLQDSLSEWPVADLRCDAEFVPDADQRSLTCASFVDRAGDSPEIISDLSRFTLRYDALKLSGETLKLSAEIPFDNKDLSFGDPIFKLDCDGCADQVARALARQSSMIEYTPNTARLDVHRNELKFEAPFTVEVFDQKVPMPLSCKIDIRTLDDGDCGIAGAEQALRQAVLTVAAREAGKALAGEVYDLGPLSVTMGTAEDSVIPDAAKGTMTLAFEVGLPDAGIKDLGTGKLILDVFGGRAPKLELDDAIDKTLGTRIADAINDLIGAAIPVKVTSVTFEPSLSSGEVPERIRVSSAASIADLFTVSVPDVLIGEEGVDVDGPRELTIGFPPGAQIPVTPFTICPTGGTVGEERLVIYTSVTLAECTASALVNIRGSAEVRFDRPVVEMRGSMVLLAFLSLGQAEAKLDLDKVTFDSVLSIGGVLSDVINYTSEMSIQGRDRPSAETRDSLQIFRVPVNEQDVKIVFASDGGIDASMRINIFDFLRATGSFGSDIEFRRPQGSIEGSARVGDWTLGGFDGFFRPDYARAGFEVLGFRLRVVVPGFDALTPGYLIKLIEALLTPDLENLDEALKAILNGNVTINPLADFSSDGGDGFGQDGSSEPPENDGNGEPAGDTQGPPEAPEAVAENSETAPSGGSGPSTLLNPPGTQRVIFRPSEDGVHDVALMEGDKELALIARVPRLENGSQALVTPIYRGAGQGVVTGLSNYIHLWKVAPTDSLGSCQEGQPTDALFAFAGGASGYVGYAELCRFGPRAAEMLTPAHSAVVVPFLSALSRAPASYPDLIALDADGNRLPPEARGLLQVGAFEPSTAAPVAALLSPGRVLVATNIERHSGEADKCTATTTGAGEIVPRTFVILDSKVEFANFEDWRRDSLPQILGGLRACDDGTVVVQRGSRVGANALDAEARGKAWLSSSRWTSVWDGAAWHLIRERDAEDVILIGPDPMIAESEETQRRMGPPPPPPPPGITPPIELKELTEKPVEGAPPNDNNAVPSAAGGSGFYLRLVSTGADSCAAEVVPSGGGDPVRSISYRNGLFETECQTLGRTVFLAQRGDRMAFLELPISGDTGTLVLIGFGDGLKLPIGPGVSAAAGYAAITAALNDRDATGAADVRAVGFDATGAQAALIFSGGALEDARMHWVDQGRAGLSLILPRVTDRAGDAALLSMFGQTRTSLVALGLRADSVLTVAPVGDTDLAISHEAPGLGLAQVLFAASADGWTPYATVLIDPTVPGKLDVLAELAQLDANQRQGFVWMTGLRGDGWTLSSASAATLYLAAQTPTVTVGASTTALKIPRQFDAFVDSWFGDDISGIANNGICEDPKYVSPTWDENPDGLDRAHWSDGTDCLIAVLRDGYELNRNEWPASFGYWNRQITELRAAIGAIPAVSSDTPLPAPAERITVALSGLNELGLSQTCRDDARRLFESIVDAGQTESFDDAAWQALPLAPDCRNGLGLVQTDDTGVRAVARIVQGVRTDIVRIEGIALPFDYLPALLDEVTPPTPGDPPVVYAGYALGPEVSLPHWAGLALGTETVTVFLGAPDTLRRVDIEGAEFASGTQSDASRLLELVLASPDGDVFQTVRRSDGGLGAFVDTGRAGADRLINLTAARPEYWGAMSLPEDWRSVGLPMQRLLADLVAAAGEALEVKAGYPGPWPVLDLRYASDAAVVRLPWDTQLETGSLAPDIQTVFSLQTGSGSAGLAASVCGDDLPLALVDDVVALIGEVIDLTVPPDRCSGHFSSAGSSNSGLLVTQTTAGGLEFVALPCPDGGCDRSNATQPLSDPDFRVALVEALADVVPAATKTSGLRILFDADDVESRLIPQPEEKVRALMIGWDSEITDGSSRFKVMLAAHRPSPTPSGSAWQCIIGPLDVQIEAGITDAADFDAFGNDVAWRNVAQRMLALIEPACNPKDLGRPVVFKRGLGNDPSDLGVGLEFETTQIWLPGQQSPKGFLRAETSYGQRLQGGSHKQLSPSFVPVAVRETRQLLKPSQRLPNSLVPAVFVKTQPFLDSRQPGPRILRANASDRLRVEVAGRTFYVPLAFHGPTLMRALDATVIQSLPISGDLISAFGEFAMLTLTDGGQLVLNPSEKRWVTLTAGSIEELSPASLAAIEPRVATAFGTTPDRIVVSHERFFVQPQTTLSTGTGPPPPAQDVFDARDGARLGKLPHRLATRTTAELETYFRILARGREFELHDLTDVVAGQRDVVLIGLGSPAQLAAASGVVEWHAVVADDTFRIWSNYDPREEADASQLASLVQQHIARLAGQEAALVAVKEGTVQRGVALLTIRPCGSGTDHKLQEAVLGQSANRRSVASNGLVDHCAPVQDWAALGSMLVGASDERLTMEQGLAVVDPGNTAPRFYGVALAGHPVQVHAELGQSRDEALGYWRQASSGSTSAIQECLNLLPLGGGTEPQKVLALGRTDPTDPDGILVSANGLALPLVSGEIKCLDKVAVEAPFELRALATLLRWRVTAGASDGCTNVLATDALAWCEIGSRAYQVARPDVAVSIMVETLDPPQGSHPEFGTFAKALLTVDLKLQPRHTSLHVRSYANRIQVFQSDKSNTVQAADLWSQAEGPEGPGPDVELEAGGVPARNRLHLARVLDAVDPRYDAVTVFTTPHGLWSCQSGTTYAIAHRWAASNAVVLETAVPEGDAALCLAHQEALKPLMPEVLKRPTPVIRLVVSTTLNSALAASDAPGGGFLLHKAGALWESNCVSSLRSNVAKHTVEMVLNLMAPCVANVEAGLALISKQDGTLVALGDSCAFDLALAESTPAVRDLNEHAEALSALCAEHRPGYAPDGGYLSAVLANGLVPYVFVPENQLVWTPFHHWDLTAVSFSAVQQWADAIVALLEAVPSASNTLSRISVEGALFSLAVDRVGTRGWFVQGDAFCLGLLMPVDSTTPQMTSCDSVASAFKVERAEQEIDYLAIYQMTTSGSAQVLSCLLDILGDSEKQACVTSVSLLRDGLPHISSTDLQAGEDLVSFVREFHDTAFSTSPRNIDLLEILGRLPQAKSQHLDLVNKRIVMEGPAHVFANIWSTDGRCQQLANEDFTKVISELATPEWKSLDASEALREFFVNMRPGAPDPLWHIDRFRRHPKIAMRTASSECKL